MNRKSANGESESHKQIQKKEFFWDKTYRYPITHFGRVSSSKNQFEVTFQLMLTKSFSSLSSNSLSLPSSKLNMAMGNGPFEDVFPTSNGDFPLPC